MPEPIDTQPDDAASDDTMEGGAASRFGLLRSLLPIIAVVILTATGGAYLAYSQFPKLAETAVSVGLDFGIVKPSERVGPRKYGQFTTINDLLINPAGSGGNRFLVLSLGLETQSGNVLSEIDEKEVVIRDAILGLLGSYTDTELASIELRSRLKDDLRDELNAILQRGTIDRLYITQYLLQ